ncbi:glycosyltransferase [Methylobacterium sp. WSM2598]|uniref:glycosyltransferase n=1 Tax=Methylobacterium sp. WSM2598 TaxID=398261 RepID=UPI00037D6E60|nr:glycosyltransferase [Methylobacterium sp. WSM2598]
MSDFDENFYYTLYPDLHHLTGRGELLEHYLRHGRREGRQSSVEGYLADLSAEHGPLPKDFRPSLYRDLNPDLASRFTEDWQFIAHYLRHGREEKRPYALDIASDADAFARVAVRDGDPEAADAFAAFLRQHGLVPGSWLLRFDLAQFVQLNADWIGPPPRVRAEGLRLFVERGIARLAPIHAEAMFDPAFYRAVYPVEDLPDDASLYRHWLCTGIERGFAPNESAHLAALIGETVFPRCFDLAGYRAALPRGAALPRTQVLEHWLDFGFPAGRLDVVSGPDEAAFLGLVGMRELLRQRFALARRAYDEAIARGGPTARRLHGRGEAARALGDLAAAAADYAAAAADPRSSLWSHIHAAECLAATGDLPAACAQIRASSPRWIKDARWREAGLGILGRAFDAACEAARAEYRQGRRAEADALLDEALNRLAADLPLAAPLPVPLPIPSPRPTVAILANLDLPQCVHYRVEQRRRQLEHAGWTVRVFPPDQARAFRQALHAARAALFYRLPAFPDILHSILYARALGLPTFYDVDDLIFDARCYPDPFDSFEGQISPEDYVGLQFGVPLFRFALAQCDEGLASTPALAEAMRPLLRTGRCHVLRNGLDQRNAPFLDRPDPAPARPEAPVTLFYGSGTKAHNRDFNALAGPALLRLLERHPQLRLLIAGHLTLDPAFAAHRDRIRRLGFTAQVEDYWEILSGVDVNLAVLAPGAAADAKSEIKWLEAAVAGVPSVVSGTRTYREILVEGEDVLFADTPEEWASALERLGGDAGLRRRIGLAARRKARRDYGLAAGAGRVASVLARPAAPAVAAARPRILLVNVFFPPQTIGGATRVVRDNLDHFLAAAGERYAFAVAASDEGVQPAGRARLDGYRGVPVLRLSTPLEPGMDWRPFNPALGALFGEFLDRLCPDLVHFHCVQRLSGSVVEAAQARGLRHVVTVHDGWWISDHQFLLDRDGQVVRPSPDLLEAASDAPHGAGAQLLRRRRLGRLLCGADRVLAVSESFAGLYRAAGFPEVRSVPNGLSLGRVPARRAGRGPRVRLGHVGGLEAHKGAPLLEVVLRTTPFRCLGLTLVDLSREPGSASEEVWGTTPVRIVGPVAQEEIGGLYGELDVLLVPSLWPESFGLVSREARAFGLWVVASDRGAVGEEVRPGVDGFVIDVSTPGPLREVLGAIDADPARFQAPPPPGPPLRRAADQGDDLLRLYDEILGRGAARAAGARSRRPHGSASDRLPQEPDGLPPEVAGLADHRGEGTFRAGSARGPGS